MSRREAALSALAIFAVAVVVRAWAASILTFPRPEDAAYYVGVARSLVDGHGLTSNATWSFQTPPLTPPKPAFEVWLPLPTFLAAIPMAIFGTTFAAAQVSSILVGGLVAVLAWRLAADVAAERDLPVGRARTMALGVGLTAGVYLPLVLASAEPDSTTPFAALVLGACLLMARLAAAGDRRRTRDLVGFGLLIGLAALTRNEAIWLALAWAIVAWQIAAAAVAASGAGSPPRERGRLSTWLRLVGIPAAVAVAIFAPWAVRDWLTFGTPLPGQALANALSLKGSDIFAWSDPPTLSRYLDAGLGTLLGLRVTGLVHNLVVVLLLLGTPISAIGLVALPWTARRATSATRATGATLRPLVLFSVITFVVTTLLFPVATTWGTFQHAAGAIEVLLLVSAVLALDGLIERVGRLRGWTNPVAWLGPALTIAAGLLFTVAVLPSEGDSARATEARYAALPTALAAAGVPLGSQPGPVITDFPIWFATTTGHTSLALPDEPPASIVDLATRFGSSLLIVQADSGGTWPDAADSGSPDAACFRRVPLPPSAAIPDPLDGVVVFRIACP